MGKIYLVESRQAILPEMKAYPKVFAEKFQVEVIPEAYGDFSDGIVWCFMGVHRRQPKCQMLVHDYRSLSTGLACAFKDRLKRVINGKPDLRVFLNGEVERIMGFKDGVGSCRIDMGVPSHILQFGGTVAHPTYEFCYIGEITRERKSDEMLEAFVSSDYRNSPLLLIGRYEEPIKGKYESRGNIHFVGRHPQEKVFELLRDSRYAISHFPSHRPHCFQTPTKLLEYACLGKAIIANRSPSNLRLASEMNLNIEWSSDRIFDDLKLSDTPTFNTHIDASAYLWERRFEQSEIFKHLDPFV